MARQDHFTHFRQGNLLVVPKREIPRQTIRSSANIIRLAQHVKKQINNLQDFAQSEPKLCPRTDEFSRNKFWY